MPVLFTIGYEGAALDDFIATLQAANIQTLIDVRQLPISRRRGFAKNALSAALEAGGIEYVHMKSLGDPKEGREAARAGKFDRFRKIYSAHLKTIEAKKGLAQAAEITAECDSCLMCYERDYQTCHRLLVANALNDIIPVRINHLGVRRGLGRERKQAIGTRIHFGQSASARGSEAR